MSICIYTLLQHQKNNYILIEEEPYWTPTDSQQENEALSLTACKAHTWNAALVEEPVMPGLGSCPMQTVT